MVLVKYLPIFKMAAIVNSFRQMLTGGPVTGACCFDEAGPDNDLDNLKSQVFLGKSNLEAPTMCVLRNLLEVHMYLNEYNKVKSSTVTAGYDVDVTNMIKVHPFMMNPLRANLTNEIKAFNRVYNKI